MKQVISLTCLNRTFVFLCLALFSSNAIAADPEITDQVLKITASVEPVGKPVSLINDGNASSNAPYWSTQQGEASYGKYEYVEMQWETKVNVSTVQVFWATASGDIALPSEAYISYWNGTEWVKATEITNIPKRGISSTTTDVTSEKIRIYMKSDKACGIREVNIYGKVVYDPSLAYQWPAYSYPGL